MTKMIKRWYRACTIAIEHEALKRGLPKENFTVTEPQTPWDFPGVKIHHAMEQLVACEEPGPVKGPYYGDEERLDFSWEDTDPDEKKQILEAIQEGGVYYKVYNVKVCHHLPHTDADDHRKWLLD